MQQFLACNHFVICVEKKKKIGTMQLQKLAVLVTVLLMLHIYWHIDAICAIVGYSDMTVTY